MTSASDLKTKLKLGVGGAGWGIRAGGANLSWSLATQLSWIVFMTLSLTKGHRSADGADTDAFPPGESYVCLSVT